MTADSPPPAPPGGFDDRLGRIADIVEGMALIDADRALDDARRLVFGMLFQGGDGGELADALGCCDEARAVAAALDGLDLDRIVEALEWVRRAGWAARYAAVPGSRFAREIAARMGLANGAPGGRLN